MPRHRRGRPPPSESDGQKARGSGGQPAHTGPPSNASSREAAHPQGDGIASDESCHQVNQPKRGEKIRRALKATGAFIGLAAVTAAVDKAMEWATAAVPWDKIPWDVLPWSG